LTLLDDAETPLRCRNLAESHFSMRSAIEKYDLIFKEMTQSL